MTDPTGNASLDTTTAELILPVQFEQEKTTSEESPMNNESTESDNRSSLSFVDLVETIFNKKDSKPTETLEQSLDTRTASKEMT